MILLLLSIKRTLFPYYSLKSSRNTRIFVSFDADLRVQEAGNTQLCLSQTEGQAVVVQHVRRLEALVVQEVRPEVVDDGTESQAVPEGGGHVVNPHVLVVPHHSSSPDLK